MAMTISMTCQSSIVIFNMKPSQRFQSNLLSPSCDLKQPKQRIGSGFLSTRGLKDFSTIKINRDFTVNSSTSPSESGSPSNPMRGPRGWLLGMVLTIALPFTTNKWGPLPKWKKDIESMVETVEEITNQIESTAEKLHEVAENIEESLPHGKLRNTFDFIENTAEEIAKGANVAGDLIDKIQEIEDKIDVFIEQSKLDKETQKVATTTTTTTTTIEEVSLAQVESQKGDVMVEPVATITIVNEVVKEEIQEIKDKVDVLIEQSKLDKETQIVAAATTTTTTTTIESVSVAQVETQKEDMLVEPVVAVAVTVEVDEVVKKEVVASRQK